MFSSLFKQRRLRTALRPGIVASATLLYSASAQAVIWDYFRLEDGHTNWQYVANTTAGLFIIILSFTIVRLLISRRQVRRYNLELEEIRSELEQRVKDRTATLDESNRLLQETNTLLEGEISQHRETTNLLRASEAYINNILRSMPLMLIGLNSQLEITQWNRRAEEITGIPASKALGQDLWDAYPVITLLPEQIREVLDSRKKMTIKQSQRGHYHFDITIYPLEEQLETGVVILIDDVTQQVTAENMLIQRDKMSAMGELAATMAHDINAPLRVMQEDIEAELKTLREANPEAHKGGHERLEDALGKGQQATAVIENLLEFAGSRDGSKQLADVTEIVEHAITLAERVLSPGSGINFQDITLHRKYAEDLPEVPCYVSELQQVMLSLFRHSCLALADVSRPDHHPEITVEISEFYNNLWIKVHHNGTGLSYDEQQSVFEPYFTSQGESADYDIAKRLSFPFFIITEQHKGEMAVTSDVNVGTTFHMQLPLE